MMWWVVFCLKVRNGCCRLASSFSLTALECWISPPSPPPSSYWGVVPPALVCLLYWVWARYWEQCRGDYRTGEEVLLLFYCT